MKIDIRNDKVVYLTIGNYEYYIDDSTGEQIVDVHRINTDECEQVKELNTHQKNKLIAEFIGHRSVMPYHNDWNYLHEAVDRLKKVCNYTFTSFNNKHQVYERVVEIIQLIDKKQ